MFLILSLFKCVTSQARSSLVLRNLKLILLSASWESLKNSQSCSLKMLFTTFCFLISSSLNFASLKSQALMHRAEAAGNAKALGVIKHLVCWKHILNPCFPENNVFVFTLNLLHHIFSSEPQFSVYLISVLISRIIENPRLNELLPCKTSCSLAICLLHSGTKHQFSLCASSLKDKSFTCLPAHRRTLGLGQHIVV